MEKILTKLVTDERLECIPCFYLTRILTVLEEILEEEEKNDL